MRFVLLLPPALLLAACSTGGLLSETPGTFSDRGRTYPTIIREYQREDGSTYSRTTIRVGAERVTCVTGDVRDCRLALTDIFVRDRS